jgi:hypothetical protein
VPLGLATSLVSSVPGVSATRPDTRAVPSGLTAFAAAAPAPASEYRVDKY